jgi:hypothetical protein
MADDVEPVCAGCGGALEVEPWPAWVAVDYDEPAPWAGAVLVLGGLGFAHDHRECVAVARC